MTKVQLKSLLAPSKKAFYYAFFFSFIMNVLTLSMSIYSLQVLDRVLSSSSLETLFVLTLITTFIFVILGVLQAVRSHVFLHISNWSDQKLSSPLLLSSLKINRERSGGQNLRDLASLKSFISGQALTHLFDAPWSLVYLAVIFMIHPLNGVLTLSGALLLLFLAWINERSTKHLVSTANDEQIKSMNSLDALSRNVDVITAMGMSQTIHDNWQHLNKRSSEKSSVASSRASLIASITKSIRLGIQMLTMCLGAVLVLKNQMTAGGIIATSILAGKVLAPFDAAITIWKSVIITRKAYQRLDKVIQNDPVKEEKMVLPNPKAKIDIENCIYALPNTDHLIIKGVSLTIPEGACIGIVGSSGSGKTTLAKLICNIIHPSKGAIRIDGADTRQWNESQLGKFMGYVPQDIELFSGTVMENIARMQEKPDTNEVIKAAQISGAHEMILKLTQGYNTPIGPFGLHLSGGQRQLIALARAFFGSPSCIVLDEPNSNLDTDGEASLFSAIQSAKANKQTSIIISHKPGILELSDYILVLLDGEAKMYDKRDVVLEKLSGHQKPIQKIADPKILEKDTLS